MGKFSLSLAIPQFGLLSHVSSLRLSSGHSGPVLTLRNKARASLFSPLLLMADVGVWATSPLGVAVRPVICGFYLFILSSWLCCPLRFQNSLQTCRWDGFLVFGNFSSFTTPSPGWVSTCNSFVSLFIFYILSYLLSKTMGCLPGCLVSSASVQKLFCGICSEFKWSANEFWGEKVVFLSYSSIIFWVKILMKNLMISQGLPKRLNELVNMLITFMVSIWKITDLNLCFPDVRKTNKQTNKKKTPSPQTNYDSKLVKLYFINKLKYLSFLSIWTLQRWKALSFQ